MNDRIKEELDITDRLLASANEVLAAIPECPLHGSSCVPHALDWVAEAKEALIELRGLRAFHRSVWDAVAPE